MYNFVAYFMLENPFIRVVRHIFSFNLKWLGQFNGIIYGINKYHGREETVMPSKTKLTMLNGIVDVIKI